MTCFKSVVLNWGQCCPVSRGIWSYLMIFLVFPTGAGDVIAISCVELRHVAEHPMMQRTAIYDKELSGLKCEPCKGRETLELKKVHKRLLLLTLHAFYFAYLYIFVNSIYLYCLKLICHSLSLNGGVWLTCIYCSD